MNIFTIIIVFMIVIVILGTLRQHRIMCQFWQRSCTGFIWRKRFPQASKVEIREFLDIFIEAFSFAERRRLCFTPDDRVMDVYRALYPPGTLTDNMELESLIQDLQNRYSADFLSTWREDITLGDLFAQGRASAAYQGGAGNWPPPL